MDDQHRENRFRALLVYPVLFYTMLLLGVGAGAGAGAGCTGGGGGGGGGGNRTGTETVELRAATVAVEEAFLSADPSNVLQLLTGEAKALHEGTISSIQSEMVSFGEDFKSRNLKSISSNYAEYEFTAAGETFTVAFSLQEDGTWKLMRF